MSGLERSALIATVNIMELNTANASVGGRIICVCEKLRDRVYFEQSDPSHAIYWQ